MKIQETIVWYFTLVTLVVLGWGFYLWLVTPNKP